MADSSLVEFDRQLAESAQMFVLGQKIEFQFAPRILSDSNSSNWMEKDIWAIEPLRIHTGSSGRRISVEWEYIATDNVFTAPKINQQLKTLKSYFFKFTSKEYPVVKFKFSGIVPIETLFRLRDSNISHGVEYVKSDSMFFPLYTKVSANLELATACQGALTSAPIDPKVNITPVNGKRAIPVEWF